MALYWMVETISVSGTQRSAIGALDFSFTFSSGQSQMRDVVCPQNDGFWGWQDVKDVDGADIPWEDVSFSSQFPFRQFQENGNVVYSGGGYYVFFDLRMNVEEGAPINSSSLSGTVTYALQITDSISVPIRFLNVDNTEDPFYTSDLSSFTCTLRDPS